jgi:hypothetical protein
MVRQDSTKDTKKGGVNTTNFDLNWELFLATNNVAVWVARGLGFCRSLWTALQYSKRIMSFNSARGGGYM